ncbi:MAG: ribbon-helix-helix protein, CopG family [Thermodesulfobacteriota bacterium]
MTFSSYMGASSVVSLRLDLETRRSIDRLARARGRSRSDVVREAVAALIERAPAEDRPYESWKPIIGIARGGRPDLSERTGERFRELLAARVRRKK